MENLRAYAEDEAQAPSVQTPVTKGPNTSEGLSASSSTSSTSASVPSTRTLSGPVQEVSAPLQSSSVVSRDKTVSLKDIPPPPPPDEPYELFLARVACQTLDPAGGTPRRLFRRHHRYLRWASAYLHLSPDLRTPPGHPFLKFRGPGFVCPYQHHATCLLLNLGLGPDGARTYLLYRSVVKLLSCPRWVLSVFRDLPPWLVDLLRLLQCKKTLLLRPRAFADFFRGPRPLLSRRRLQPAWLLRLSRWIRRLMRTFLQDLLQPWSRTGKRKYSRTCDCTGSSCKVTLHLSQLWAPLFPRETWAPTHCGSWVPLATERRHGLSISPVQNEQAASLADAAVHARDHLVTVLDEGTVVPGRLRTPLPAVAGLPLPVAHA